MSVESQKGTANFYECGPDGLELVRRKVITTTIEDLGPDQLKGEDDHESPQPSITKDNLHLYFRPRGKQIVIKKDELPDEIKTPGGIYLSTQTQTPPQVGDVVAVGTGVYESGALNPVKYRVGERVLFSKYAGAEVTIYGEDYLVIGEDQIYGVFFNGEE